MVRRNSLRRQEHGSGNYEQESTEPTEQQDETNVIEAAEVTEATETIDLRFLCYLLFNYLSGLEEPFFTGEMGACITYTLAA